MKILFEILIISGTIVALILVVYMQILLNRIIKTCKESEKIIDDILKHFRTSDKI